MYLFYNFNLDTLHPAYQVCPETEHGENGASKMSDEP